MEKMNRLIEHARRDSEPASKDIPAVVATVLSTVALSHVRRATWRLTPMKSNGASAGCNCRARSNKRAQPAPNSCPGTAPLANTTQPSWQKKAR